MIGKLLKIECRIEPFLRKVFMRKFVKVCIICLMNNCHSHNINVSYPRKDPACCDTYLNSGDTSLGYLQYFLPHPPFTLLDLDIVIVTMFLLVVMSHIFNAFIECIQLYRYNLSTIMAWVCPKTDERKVNEALMGVFQREDQSKSCSVYGYVVDC